MLSSLLHSVTCLFCQHEWLTCTRSSRLCLECMKCLATSPGVEMRREVRRQPQQDGGNVLDHGLSPGRLAA